MSVTSTSTAMRRKLPTKSKQPEFPHHTRPTRLMTHPPHAPPGGVEKGTDGTPRGEEEGKEEGERGVSRVLARSRGIPRDSAGFRAGWWQRESRPIHLTLGVVYLRLVPPPRIPGHRQCRPVDRHQSVPFVQRNPPGNVIRRDGSERRDHLRLYGPWIGRRPSPVIQGAEQPRP